MSTSEVDHQSFALKMEIASRTVGMVSLMGRYDNIMKFFTRVQREAGGSSNLDSDLLDLEVLRLRVSRWGEASWLSGNVANLRGLSSRAGSRKHVSRAMEILDDIATHFEDFAKTAEHHEVEDEVPDVSDSDSTNEQILTRRLRGISNGRLSNTNILAKGRWLLKFDQFCHKSFHRQCQLSTTQAKWIVQNEDDLQGLIGELKHSVKDLEISLKALCPRNHARISQLCNSEVQNLRRHNPLSFSQLVLLYTVAAASVDIPLKDAILREEKNSAPANVHTNVGGTAGSRLQFDSSNRI